MARLHLFEFEDLAWFPRSIRNYGTDFLQFLSVKTSLFDPAWPLLRDAIKKSKQQHVLDLASGGGGPWSRLSPRLSDELPGIKVSLTDYYPNQAAFERLAHIYPNLVYSMEPVDARKVPANILGFRTMFLSFHHFKPEQAQAILQDSVDRARPIAIFEGQERSLLSLLAMLFSPISLILSTPLIRPFSIGRLIFTYLIPLLPLMVLWDGLVSSLRTYSTSELQSLVDSLENKESFEWDIQRIRSGPGVLIYLIGLPKS